MIFLKGRRVHIHHQVRGEFFGIVQDRIDTSTTEFFFVTLDQDTIPGHQFKRGDSVGCEMRFCSIVPRVVPLNQKNNNKKGCDNDERISI